ncbi:MAG: efflux RND transporter periplasmic adaptor subunit [Acuticoccus sp.]
MIVRLLLAVVLAGAIAAWMWSGSLVVAGSAEEANPRPPAERREADSTPFRVRVRTITSEERQQTLTMRGRTRADALVEVAAETAARIVARPVHRGNHVKAGDLLCQLDPGVRQAQLAQAKAEAARAALEHQAATKLQGRGFESQTRVAATQAALDAAQAGVAAAEQQLAHAAVLAPIDGVVQEPLAEVGAVLQLGHVCATIVDADPIIVTGQVTERDVAKIKLGVPVDVALVTGEAVTGNISFISRTGQADTRTFTVEIEVPNKDLTLRAGVTAEAQIPLDPVIAHRLSPGVLTLDDRGMVGVRTIDDNNVVAFRPVVIAGQDKDGFWVKGLPDTVTIITVGQDFVAAGETVDPVHVDAGDDA